MKDKETLGRIRALAIRPPGPRCGSAATRSVTSRRPAPTRPAGASTGTTTTGASADDAEKFDRMLEFAHRLPDVQAGVRRPRRRDLREKALDRGSTPDLGSFRVGSESYTRENGSYGVATILRTQVRVSGDSLAFDGAKSGKRRRLTLVDPELRPVVTRLKRDGTTTPSCSRTATGRDGATCDRST